MATGKHFYYIKVKDSFVTSDVVDFFMSQPNGANYVVLYQMLCMMTLKSDGRLERRINEVIIKFDIGKIQRYCKWFSEDTIRVALELYKRFGLIYEDVDGTLVISDYGNVVGSESDYAAQKRNQRRLKSPDNSGNLMIAEDSSEDESADIGVDIVHTEIRDQRLEIRDQRLETRDKKEDLGISKDIPSQDDLTEVASAWNSLDANKVVKIAPSSTRGKMLKCRIKEYGMDNVLKAIENVRNSAFLLGHNDRGWMITFDWFVKPNNFQKVLEGNYAGKSNAGMSKGEKDFRDWQGMMVNWASEGQNG